MNPFSSKGHLVVFGGSRGLGRALTLMASKSFGTISVLSRSPLDDQSPWPANVGHFSADLLDSENVAKALSSAVAKHGKISGAGCEMDAIMEIVNRHGIAVVEDNAHGLFGRYKGRWLGTFGRMATQSFFETKNITCGERGTSNQRGEVLGAGGDHSGKRDKPSQIFSRTSG